MKTWFIADGMLGKLAKWLRILGCDTRYYPGTDDGELASAALKEKRILLTRDTGLVRRKTLRQYLFIKSDDPFEQLREVIRAKQLTISREALFSRCLTCNEKVVRIKKADVKEKVPAYVFETQSYFKVCPKCKKVFWRGTHVDNTMKKIKSLTAT